MKVIETKTKTKKTKKKKKKKLKKASIERDKTIKFVGQTQSKLNQIHNPKQLSGGETFL